MDKNCVENISAALECRDLISDISISIIRGPELENLLPALHEPLPILTRFTLRLTSADYLVPVLTETFLGGSAPRLREFTLGGIPFPSFPKFISRSTHIVYLHLHQVPDSWDISPEIMAGCLTTLRNLKRLLIAFRSPPSRLLPSIPPHLTRAVIPALCQLGFSGASKYFEDFVARIDTPRLTWLYITFFMNLNFDVRRLRDFIDHTEGLRPFNRATIKWIGRLIKIDLGSSTRFVLEVGWHTPDRQLSSITQIFSQQLPVFSHVEQLELQEYFGSEGWKDVQDMDSSQWLQLFRLFVAAQTLYVSKRLVFPVATALQGLTVQMATEVLPVLRTLFLEGLEPSGLVHEAIKSFAKSRQLSHRPVDIQRWGPSP
jgi:hypothetical protein